MKSSTAARVFLTDADTKVAFTAPEATPGIRFRPRGLIAVRNDGDPAQILAEINRTFAEFKASNDNRIKELENKLKSDVVNVEQVTKISNEITALGKLMDESQKAIAALKITGGSNDNKAQTAEQKAHATAFNRWFRKGQEPDAGMRDLQVKASLSTDSDPDGGYVVPEEMSTVIDRVVGVYSIMRQLAQVLTIGTDEYQKLMNMGGAGYGWVGERQARGETTTPTLKGMNFPVFEIYANPFTTQKLLDDSRVSIEEWLSSEVSTVFAEAEGSAFVGGDGVLKPKGLLAYPVVANASYAWGSIGYVASGGASGFASSNPADALISLFYALKQGYRAGASWLTSDAVMATIRQFKDGQGNYLWAPPANSADVPTILGKPVYTDDNMQALGANTYPVSFGDFKRAYLVLDRFGIRVLRDPYTNKPYVGFYTTKRVGGGIQNFEAVKVLKCATS